MGGRSGGRSEENRNKRMEKDGEGWRRIERDGGAGYCRGPGPSRAVAPQMMMI
jgi:hypothetical protein